MYCRGIVCSDTKPAFFRMVDWTMAICSLRNGAHLPVTWFNSPIACKICYNFLVLLIALVHSRCSMIIIIISNSLFRSSSDSVMMLVYTHSIKHDIFGFQNLLYLRVLSFLIYNFICENFIFLYVGVSMFICRPRPRIYGYCRSVYFKVKFNRTVSNFNAET